MSSLVSSEKEDLHKIKLTGLSNEELLDVSLLFTLLKYFTLDGNNNIKKISERTFSSRDLCFM